MQDSTITNLSLELGETDHGAPRSPQLVVLANVDAPQQPSSRHVLDDLDEVRFGRGDRAAVRSLIDGRRVLDLRIADRRMSSNHGKLVRTPLGWMLDDPESKNGAIVDGAVVRRQQLTSGSVVELGHTFFVFRHAELERDAPADVTDADLVGLPFALRTFDGALAGQIATLRRVAPSEISVLLQGETGTGKELVARAVHELSGRTGAFVAVNCGALPANLIEAELFGHRRGAFTGAAGERLGLVRSADGGTLFLDEVGELPAGSQAAFLRVLQEREVTPIGVDHPIKVDVRLCSATLRDLEALVESGQFRRDLYARLFGHTIELPPLRARKVDLGLLIRHMLGELPGGDKLAIAPAAMRALLRGDWPLNIRELQKMLATAAVLAVDGTIELGHLPDAVRRPRTEPVADASTGDDDTTAPEPRARSDEHLKAEIELWLTRCKGNVIAVGREMKVRRTQLYRWFARFGIDPKNFRK